jgi:hypothetical protein
MPRAILPIPSAARCPKIKGWAAAGFAPVREELPIVTIPPPARCALVSQGREGLRRIRL